VASSSTWVALRSRMSVRRALGSTSPSAGEARMRRSRIAWLRVSLAHRMVRETVSGAYPAAVSSAIRRRSCSWVRRASGTSPIHVAIRLWQRVRIRESWSIRYGGVRSVPVSGGVCTEGVVEMLAVIHGVLCSVCGGGGVEGVGSKYLGRRS